MSSCRDNNINNLEREYIKKHHRHDNIADNQCASVLLKHIKAPVHLNYSSIISVHPKIIEKRPGTLVVESFVVDVPEGNTKTGLSPLTECRCETRLYVPRMKLL